MLEINQSLIKRRVYAKVWNAILRQTVSCSRSSEPCDMDAKAGEGKSGPLLQLQKAIADQNAQERKSKQA